MMLIKYVGHTPQINKGINSICNGKLWYTDVGVSKAFDVADMNVVMTGERSKKKGTSFRNFKWSSTKYFKINYN